MSPLSTSLVVFAWVFGGALVGMGLRRILPEHHRSPETRDVVKLGMGLIATMSALLLGLLVASAKSSYDEQKTELTQMTSKLVLLDHALAMYGTETKETREMLRAATAHTIEQLWPTGNPTAAALSPAATRGDRVYEGIQALSPKNDLQRSLQAQATSLAMDLGQTRWLMFEQRGRSVSTALLAVVVFWLAIIFASFGLFAPPNATVMVTLFACALSVSCAIFLILEMDQPFDGFLQISSAPLREALAQLGH